MPSAIPWPSPVGRCRRRPGGRSLNPRGGPALHPYQRGMADITRAESAPSPTCVPGAACHPLPPVPSAGKQTDRSFKEFVVQLPMPRTIISRRRVFQDTEESSGGVFLGGPHGSTSTNPRPSMEVAARTEFCRGPVPPADVASTRENRRCPALSPPAGRASTRSVPLIALLTAPPPRDEDRLPGIRGPVPPDVRRPLSAAKTPEIVEANDRLLPPRATFLQGLPEAILPTHPPGPANKKKQPTPPFRVRPVAWTRPATPIWAPQNHRPASRFFLQLLPGEHMPGTNRAAGRAWRSAARPRSSARPPTMPPTPCNHFPDPRLTMKRSPPHPRSKAHDKKRSQTPGTGSSPEDPRGLKWPNTPQLSWSP